MPVNNSRWVGLRSAAMPVSIPKTWCHSRSPTPPTANTATPTTPRPYPRGTAWVQVPCSARRVCTMNSTHSAVAVQPE
jgi:hypothetical protein